MANRSIETTRRRRKYIAFKAKKANYHLRIEKKKKDPREVVGCSEGIQRKGGLNTGVLKTTVHRGTILGSEELDERNGGRSKGKISPNLSSKGKAKSKLESNDYRKIQCRLKRLEDDAAKIPYQRGGKKTPSK